MTKADGAGGGVGKLGACQGRARTASISTKASAAPCGAEIEIFLNNLELVPWS
jgi:hypothetical protein